MARVVKNTDAQVISCQVITTFQNGTTSTKSLKVGDIVEGLRYIENSELKSVTGKLTKININIKTVTKVDLNNVKDYFSNDVEVKSLVIDASEQYQSNVITVNAREIVEDEGVFDVTRVDTISHAAVTMDIEYTDGTVSLQELEVNDVIVNTKIMAGTPGKPDIEGDFIVKAFAYTIVNAAPKISGVYLVPIGGGTAVNAPLKNFIQLEEKAHANVSDPSSFVEIANALNEAEDGIVYAELDVDVTIPKREDGRITTTAIGEGKTLNLDLNGHNVDVQAYAFYVNGGVLNISDSTGNGVIKTHVPDKAYPAIMVTTGGVCNMDSGKIDTTELDPDAPEGSVNWMYGVVCSGDGVFNMTGGEIILDSASGISITNGTASGEGAQFIISGNSRITSNNCAAVYLADNKKVVIKDNAVVTGGIVARMGDIEILDNAVVTGSANPEPLADQVMLSGVCAPSAAVLALTGIYKSDLGNDLSINVAKSAKLKSLVGNGLEIATINTKYDQKADVVIDSSSSVDAPGSVWKVYNHDELAELVAESGRTLAPETNSTDLTIKLDGSIVYPVLIQEGTVENNQHPENDEF